MYMNEFMEPDSAMALTDETCVARLIEIVPPTRNANDPCKSEGGGGDWSAEVKQEILQQVKLEPGHVHICYIVTLMKN